MTLYSKSKPKILLEDMFHPFATSWILGGRVEQLNIEFGYLTEIPSSAGNEKTYPAFERKGNSPAQQSLVRGTS